MLFNIPAVGSGGGAGAESRISVYLNRLTGFDHQCRVRYNVGVVRVHLEMLLANTLSELCLGTTAGPGASPVGVAGVVPSVAAATAAAAGSAAPAQCYDRDKQAWTLRSDCHSDTVRLHMVYKDIHNVPRNHLR
ncbi:Protein of unknown function [Gryllus bimaculatus]|nr:Protein of unknown function [Gryllus bimaculatus]